jgi:phage portal protein BeeE
VAIEIENLAKIYNRNYLLNDGRPGGLLVVRGEIDEDDKEELRNRFRGNLARAGHTTVIAADDGVDFVDTSANPRDAAYVQMVFLSLLLVMPLAEPSVTLQKRFVFSGWRQCFPIWSQYLER